MKDNGAMWLVFDTTIHVNLIFFVQCFVITQHSELHHSVCVQLIHVHFPPRPFLLPSPPFSLPPPSCSFHLCSPIFFSLMLSFIPLILQLSPSPSLLPPTSAGETTSSMTGSAQTSRQIMKLSKYLLLGK